MLRSFLLVGLILPSLAGSLQAAEPADQWTVVTAAAFREAIEPLCKQRRAQGYQVTVLQCALSPEEVRANNGERLREQVVGLCRAGKGKNYVLLVGAFSSEGLSDPQKQLCPPLRGTAERMKGQLTDHGYSSPAEDLMPTVAVGRFPARTPDEAARMVRKTIAFENDTKPGVWRQRLVVLAGVPAFNPFVDKLVENLAFTRLDRLDPVWTGNAIYHNPGSRFCVPDDALNSLARGMVQSDEGQFLTLYLGHSGPEAFYAGRAHFLDRRDWQTMRLRHAGVFATFGCFGCQWCGREGEGYGVAAMRNPDGPIGVLGSHGICFAAIVQLAADGLLQSLARRPPEHLGDLWLAVESAVAHDKIDQVSFALLDAVDGDRSIPLATQRREHLEMFQLLGDPATRLPTVSRDVRLTVNQAGGVVTVQGKLPEQLARASVRVTLERPVSSVPAGLEPAPEKPSKERDQLILRNWERANRFVLDTQQVDAHKGVFAARLTVPEGARWPRLIVRGYAVQGEREGVGIQIVSLQR